MRDVMTTRVVAVRQTAPYKVVAACLRQWRVSGFPVLDDDDRVIGVVSEADLLAKEALDGGLTSRLDGVLRRRAKAKAAGVTAADLMTRPAVTVGPDEPVTRAVRLLYASRVKRLPVVNPDGRLAGIVTRSDVLSVYARDDGDIRDDILRDLVQHKLLTLQVAVGVTVVNGVVTIQGSPPTAAAGHHLIEVARQVEGVVAVRDRLRYPLAGGGYGPDQLF